MIRHAQRSRGASVRVCQQTVTMATHCLFVIECCEETVTCFWSQSQMIAHVQVSRWRRMFGSTHACLRSLAVVSGYQQRTPRLTSAGLNFTRVRLNVRFVQSGRSERLLVAAGVDGSTCAVLCCVVLWRQRVTFRAMVVGQWTRLVVGADEGRSEIVGHWSIASLTFGVARKQNCSMSLSEQTFTAVIN